MQKHRRAVIRRHRPAHAVIADPADYPAATPPVWPLAEAIARIAGACHTTPQPRPVPLYLREADAAPPSDAPPALIEP